MNSTFIPKSAKGKDAKFKGEIILKRLSFDDKMEFLEAIGADLNEDLQVQIDTKSLSFIRKMVKASQKFYVKVDLMHISTKKEFKSFEDLNFDSKCYEILVEVASHLMQQGDVGN